MSLQDDRRESFIAWMKASGLNMNLVAVASKVEYNTIRSYVVETKGKRTGSLSGENEAKIAGAYNLAVEDIFGASPGSEPRPNHLKAWRISMDRSLDDLAESLSVPASTVEFWENQPDAPSDKWIRRVAAALGVRTGFVSDYDPTDLDTAGREMALLPVAKPPERAAEAPAQERKRA